MIRFSKTKIEFQYEAWKQFEQLQLWYQNGVREFVREQATLASRAAAIDAAGDVREQERQVNLNVISAVAERRLEDKYVKTLEKLREERFPHAAEWIFAATHKGSPKH